MARAQWAVGALTVTLLGTGVAMLHSTQGAEPEPVAASDALPSRALGLTGHRRLVRELEPGGEYAGQAGPHAPGSGSRPARGSSATVPPMRAARPVHLRIPSLEVDLHVSSRNPEGRVRWDPDSPAPGSAGTAVVTGKELRLAGLRRGRVIEIARADHRTAVFTVDRVVPVEAGGGVPQRGGRAERAGHPERAGLKLVGADAVVVARLTGRHHTR